jgi:hypothetical protein
MPDEELSGPTRATVALIVVLALPVVLVLMFLIVGRVRAGQEATLPQLETKGLKWAEARANTAGFDNVTSHDALGRDRGQRDTKSWQVCFMRPGSGKHTRNTEIELGVVRLSEKCPSSDQGRIERAGAIMPNLLGRTAYMARVALGDDASIRFVDVVSQSAIDHNLGDYRICTQEPAAGEPWDGVPVKAAVVPYNDDCAHPGPGSTNLDPTEVLNRVLNELS